MAGNVSVKNQQVISVSSDNIEVIRGEKLFELKIDGKQYLSTHNLATIVRPLEDQKLAKLIQEAFQMISPNAGDLKEKFKGCNMTFTFLH